MRAALLSLVGAVVLCLAASGSAVADLPESVGTLSGAINARIAVLGTPTTKPTKTELKQLKKAANALTAFGGTLLVPDLNQLRKAGAAIAASKTTDEGVISGALAAVNELLSALQSQEAQLYVLADQFAALSDRDELDSLIVLARGDAAEASELAATDVPAALVAARSAGVRYYRALRFAEGVLEAFATQPQPNLRYPFVVRNANGVKFKVNSVSIDVFFTPSGGGMPQRLSANLADYNDPVAGLSLPYTLVDRESEFPMYPLIFAALADKLGGTPLGGTINGSLKFKSTKHGLVDVPIVDFFVEAPQAP